MTVPRHQAAQILADILSDKGSLAALSGTAKNPEAALVRELCMGVCRFYPLLGALTDSLMQKPLKRKDYDVLALILIGLYQLYFMRVPDHAAINETVGTTRKPWAKGLINAVLRNALRRYPEFPKGFSDSGLCSYAQQLAHPQWLVDRLQADWPAHADALLQANNKRAPMTLRLNLQANSREEYLTTLKEFGIEAQPGKLADTAVYLQVPVTVTDLPGFNEGFVSVQDEASQCIPAMLDLQPGLNILDACAAPGGKTMALLEAEAGLSITAIDPDQRRLEKMSRNLERVKQTSSVSLICDKANNPGLIKKLPTFDRVLVDAPCSATGIIRRHPDIKVLRTPEQVEQLQTKQAQLLDSLWAVVKPGGKMLYTTCSVLKSENCQQITRFLERTPDATCTGPERNWGINNLPGMQSLTTSHGQDGFYYALLQKC